LLSGT
jgi:hypothetical protein